MRGSWGDGFSYNHTNDNVDKHPTTTDFHPAHSSNGSDNRNRYADRNGLSLADPANSESDSSQPGAQPMKRDMSKYQPTVEDVPDEDDLIDRKSNMASSCTDLETGTGSSQTSMSSEVKESPKPAEGKRKPDKKGPPSHHQQYQQGSTGYGHNHVPPTPTEGSPATTEVKANIPEMEPRRRTPYPARHGSGKPEEVARVPYHLNTTPNSNPTHATEGSRRRPYSYIPPKEDTGTAIPERKRQPYTSTNDTNSERTKLNTSRPEQEDPILIARERKPAPYAGTFGRKTTPPPNPSPQKSPYPTSPNFTSPSISTSPKRRSWQYCHVNPSQPSPGSENTSTPIRRRPSKGRAESRSRPSTASGGVRTPRGSYDDVDYDNPIVSKFREGAERRSAPYISSYPDSISPTTAHKVQNTPSQGTYSQIPQKLHSSGSLKRTSSPAISHTSTGSGRFPPISPHSGPFPPPRCPPAPLSAANAYYPPPFAPDLDEFTNESQPHPKPHLNLPLPYYSPSHQSPASAPVGTPIWASETDPGPPCPESTHIPWGTWYHPPYAPKFTICEGCFRRYISFTPFAVHFFKIDDPKASVSSHGAVVPQNTVHRSCMFHSTLSRQLWQNMCNAELYSQQQDSNREPSVFYAYAQRRAELVGCSGPVGVKPPITFAPTRELHSNWPQWWACPNYLPNFLICEACFADYIDTTICIPPDKTGVIPPTGCTSPYVQFFQQYDLDTYLRQHPSIDPPAWICDVGSNMLIKHLLEEANKSPHPGVPQENWDHFIRLARWRLEDARPCPGSSANDQSDQALVIGGGRRWYRCTKNLAKGTSLIVCEACYYDTLVPANISHEFVDLWVDGHDIQPHCHLSMIEYRFPLSMAKETKDYNIFWDAASWGLGLPKCDDRGYVLGNPQPVKTGAVPKVEWYVLFSGPESDSRVLMECCPRCFHMFIKPATFGDHFDRVLPGLILDRGIRNEHPGSTVSVELEHIRLRICDLISSPPRWKRIFFKLLEAAHQRDFTLLSSWLWTSARLTPCARDAVIYKPSPTVKGTGGQRWYSTPGDDIQDTIIACEECYDGLIRGTPLQGLFSDITEGIISHLNESSTKQETVLLCSLYSPRQRELLARCLEDLNLYPNARVDGLVAPLVQASTTRYREFMDVREELQELEDERREHMEVQMAGLRLDNEWGVVSRYQDLDARMTALIARWKDIE